MKVYITKYALTAGIFSVEAKITDGSDMISYRPDEKSFLCYAHKGEWHSCADKAIARAEEMRIAKLKSLDKQAKKVSAMVFEIAP